MRQSVSGRRSHRSARRYAPSKRNIAAEIRILEAILPRAHSLGLESPVSDSPEEALTEPARAWAWAGRGCGAAPTASHLCPGRGSSLESNRKSVEYSTSARIPATADEKSRTFRDSPSEDETLPSRPARPNSRRGSNE